MKPYKPSPPVNKRAQDMSTRTGLPHKVAEALIEKQHNQAAFKDNRNSGKLHPRNVPKKG